MKARLFIKGLLLCLAFASLGVVSFAQANSNDTEFLNNQYFYYDYPAFAEYDIKVDDWMICPNAFNNDEYYQHLDLSWLDPSGEFFHFNELDETELLSDVEVFWDGGDETVVMEWMMNFEPHVVEALTE